MNDVVVICDHYYTYVQKLWPPSMSFDARAKTGRPLLEAAATMFQKIDVVWGLIGLIKV